MQTTRHTAAALRWLMDGPAGLVEARITPTFVVVVHHQDVCDGDHCTFECDAEGMQGAEMALGWQLGGDDTVWQVLRDIHTRAELASIPQPPHEPTAEQRAFAARTRTAAEQMEAEGYFRNGR